MPTVAAIVWTAIAGIIVIMLGVIGYLIRTGFDGLKSQLAKIWEKIDDHQAATEANSLAIAQINARCDERHRDWNGAERRKTGH